ncbi:MAG: acyltransferase family protein, partial [Alphaproteobacteria bacterium]
MAVLSVAAIASFALGSALYPSAPWFTYYMLPTRAGEFLVGAILAFAVASGAIAAPGRPLREAAGAAGAALVLGSFALLSENAPFPGWRAIPPTVGAGLVLLSGQGAPSRVSRVLSVGPLVAIGIVSYSAYLWHWPLIAFWRYGFRDVSSAAAFSIFVATFALAAASHRWIESPARRTARSPGSVVVRQWLLPGAVVVAASIVSIATSGYGPRVFSAIYAERLADDRDQLRPAVEFDFVCQFGRVPVAVTEATRCVNGSPESPGGLLLLGDSNAAHFVGMLDVISRAAGFRFVNVESFSCPPLFDSPGRFAVAPRRADCDASGEAWRSIVAEFPVVVLAGMWSAYATNQGFFHAL